MTQPISIVIFDMDGMLAQLDRAHRLAILAQITGKSPEFLHAAVLTLLGLSAQMQ